MKEGDSLALFDALPEAERRSLIHALQAIAEAEGAAVKWSGVDSLRTEPRAVIVRATRGDDGLVLHFRYDFSISRFAQSGSDWTELHTHTGQAVCRGGVVLSHTLQREERSVIDRP